MADPYRVDILAKASKEFDEALARLPLRERLNALAIFTKVVGRLKVEPFEFGEELYDLKSLGLQVRLGIQLPIAIHFGADAVNRIVIIQSVAVMG